MEFIFAFHALLGGHDGLPELLELPIRRSPDEQEPSREHGYENADPHQDFDPRFK
jgi:hypothetical protein